MFPESCHPHYSSVVPLFACIPPHLGHHWVHGVNVLFPPSGQKWGGDLTSYRCPTPNPLLFPPKVKVCLQMTPKNLCLKAFPGLGNTLCHVGSQKCRALNSPQSTLSHDRWRVGGKITQLPCALVGFLLSHGFLVP